MLIKAKINFFNNKNIAILNSKVAITIFIFNLNK